MAEMMPARADVGAVARGAVRKTAWRLVPPLFAGTMLLLLDRAAVGYVSPQIGQALGMTVFEVGLATPILFLGMLLFEVPSAFVSARVGARTWLAGLMAAWGLAAVATAVATGPGVFYAARCVSSLAQAGFVPVAVFLVAGRVPDGFRTRVLAWVVVAGLATAVAEPHVMRLLLGLDGVAGLAGWRWLFLGLGAACLPLAAVLRWRLPGKGPAGWLSAAEEDALAWMRSVEPRQRRAGSSLEALLDPRVLLLCGVGFGISLSTVAAGAWYAALVQDPRAPRVLLAVVFVAVILATLVIWCRRADRTGRVADGLVVACALATVGYAAGVFPDPMVVQLTGLGAHAATLAVARAMVWSVGSRLAFAGGGAAALAMIDAAGLVGAFVAPRMLLGVVQQAGSLQLGLIFMVAALMAVTVLAGLLRLLGRRG